MTQNASDVEIANQGFAAFRQDLNDVLEDITTLHSGDTAPSTTYANQWWYETDTDKLYIRNEDNDAWIEILTLDQANDHLATLGATITLDGSGNASIDGTFDVNGNELILDADGDTSITADTDDQIDFKVGGSDVLSVTTSGVDFGATSDASTVSNTASDYQLQLGAAQSTTGDIGRNISFGSSGATTAAINSVDAGTGGAQALAIFTGNTTSISERMRIDSSGNVGIGTTSPSQPLHAYGDTTSSRRLRVENSDGYADFAAHLGGAKIFANDTTQAIDIFSDGNVHIGETSNQNRKFVVRQSGTATAGRFIRTTNTDSVNSVVDIIDSNSETGTGVRTMLNLDYDDDANVDGAYFIRFQDEGGTIGRVEANSSSVSYVTTSDYRLKTNVADYGSAIDKVKNLRPVSFDWVNTGNSDVGFIAHELAEHVPNVVSGTKDATTTKEKSDGTTASVIDPQGVDYGKLTPYLTAALKEAIAKIETLETKVATLETQATDFETRIAALESA